MVSEMSLLIWPNSANLFANMNYALMKSYQGPFVSSYVMYYVLASSVQSSCTTNARDSVCM